MALGDPHGGGSRNEQDARLCTGRTQNGQDAHHPAGGPRTAQDSGFHPTRRGPSRVAAFRSYDLLSLGFLLLTALLIAIFHRNLDHWLPYVLRHLFLACLILLLAFLAERLGEGTAVGVERTSARASMPSARSSVLNAEAPRSPDPSPSRIPSISPRAQRTLSLLRDLYPFPLLIHLFEEMEGLTHLLFPDWKNHLLISADRLLFGTDPTVWFERIYSPLLTETLEFIYLSYYALLPAGGLLFYLLVRRDAFHKTLTATALAFYACFIGYFLLPAEGPWKTLAQLQSLDLDTSFFHRIVAAVQSRGGIVGGCFPSAHVGAVFAVLGSLYFVHRRLFLPFLIYGVLLAVATVYGRYHYAVDALAGAGIGISAAVIAARPRPGTVKP